MGYIKNVNKTGDQSMSDKIADICSSESYQENNGAVSIDVTYISIYINKFMEFSHDIFTVTYMDCSHLCCLQTVITDCRHDSTANAYHSTVAMLSYE